MSKTLASSRPMVCYGARGRNMQCVAHMTLPRRKLLYMAVVASLSMFCHTAVAGVGATVLPTGGSVAGGIGSISQSGSSMTIHQATSKLALNWGSFNVGSGATVKFVQPSVAAIALNRVVGQNASEIFGHMDANGQVFLINPHGILFGPTAELNVGGLVASSLGMTSSDFMKGKYDLNANGSVASVVNDGIINAASGGSVSLLGGEVTNDGLIVANYGQINLDGANQAVLNFGNHGLIDVQITGKLKQQLAAEHTAVVNNGTLQANSGTVILQASAARNIFTNLVNNTGAIIASGINTNGGVVRLIANGGNTLDSGTINATGTQGGNVEILSDQDVGVTGDVNVSGAQGGGSINVGDGPNIAEGLPTAAVSYIGPSATLNANANQSGNGGSVMVWGNEGNNFYGTITANGGVQSGNGGQVETSAPNGLNVYGSVDASASAGDAGSWLLDPYDVTINTSTSSGITTSASGSTTDFTATGSSSTIDNISINNALTGGADVYIFTGTGGSGSGSITVDAPIAAYSGTSSLYLEAAGSIILNAGISNGSATSLNLYLWANYSGSSISTTYTAGTDTSAAVDIGKTGNANISTGGGNVDINTGAGNGSVIIGDGYDGGINTGTGSLRINTGSIVQGSTTSGDALTVGGVSSFNAGTGVITLANTGNAFGGAVSLTGGATQITDKGSLMLGTLDTGALTATSGGLLDLGTGTVGGALDATSGGGAITQNTASGDALTVGGVSSFNAGTGGITLGNSGNDFTGAVTATGTGITIQDANNLNIALITDGSNGLLSLIAGGTLTLPTRAINTGNGDLTLASNGGTLTTPGNLSGANVSLTGSRGLTLNQDVTSSGNLSLTSSKAGIDQTSGVLKVNTLMGSSAGSTTLGGSNMITDLGNFTAAGFSLDNAQSLTVSSGATVNGGSSTALTTNGGNLTINGTVDGTTTTLTSAGTIGEGTGGLINATDLTGSSVGSTTLGGSNMITDLGNFTAAGFSLDNAQSLTVNGPLNSSNGSGNISLTTASGPLVLNASLSGGNVTLDSAGALALAHNINGINVNLESGSNIDQTAGVITATTLTGSSAGSTTLGGSNMITDLGNFTAAGFSLDNAQSLTVSSGATVNGGSSTALTTNGGNLTINGTVDGTTTTLTSADTIGEGTGGLINATDLTGSSVGSTTLGGSNMITDLGNFTAAGFSLNNAQSLTVSSGATVNGGSSTALTTNGGNLTINGTVDGTTTTLTSAGTIGEGTGGLINATDLTGSSVGSTTLGGSNMITDLGNFTAAGFSLDNAQSLTVNGPLNSSNGSGNISLTTASGPLVLNASLSGGMSLWIRPVHWLWLTISTV
ncbi:beta strand repeat-containing protein [Acidithiobacillus ferrivorans]|uniref:Filamentous hemagglutinin N-terminal domain-containing protein n=1 Tax=Acidithiobacillus ferrivorans TaxID=160808 RepID=A0A7T5BIH6_9PROT|nr:filamentous hemagglutinin N-terminal domain-containing protein [Acidithiobacillus ferrivorans]QQD73658.1 filamentous hemagglutinin N-terminal domain-containing protein [Acidithiobacillus ferrivorans]